MTENIGTYLATRLLNVGIRHYFTVPGDYNLLLLDQLLKKSPELQLISCCNELNAGYAADGYARANGAAALVVTYCVGGLSALNAVAGAFSADLPLIVISGGPNSNDMANNRILHHTLGFKQKRNEQMECYKVVTCHCVVINNPVDAPSLIDKAISKAMRKKKPVYIEISCNVSALSVPKPVPFVIRGIPSSNPQSLKNAVTATAKLFANSTKVALVAGVFMRKSNAESQFQKLAEKLGCATAIMPDAKGFVDEEKLENYIGTYWGNVSSPGVSEIIESADIVLFAGPNFTDYSTVGFSALLQRSKMIEVTYDRVKLPSAEYGCLYMAEFFEKLSEEVERNDKTWNTWKRMHRSSETIKDKQQPAPEPSTLELTTNEMISRIQSILTKDTTVIVETGDAWFQGQRLKLPSGAKYEIQMQYGSIGWSVGATLGYSCAISSTKQNQSSSSSSSSTTTTSSSTFDIEDQENDKEKSQKRVIALIGDGSFQMTAQEVSTMIRYGLNPIIFLLNNNGYIIEVEIHDGIYNEINNWNYSGLVKALAGDNKNVLTGKVTTEKELVDILEQAHDFNGVTFIECILDRHDCTKELLQWGSRVAHVNSRPPTFNSDFE